MTKADQPSEHLRLAAELAVGLARRLSMTLEPGDLPDYYWHYAQTPFEDGCDVLWELGVALTLVTTATGYQGMTRQQYVDAKGHPGEETFAVYKFFQAHETRARVLACGEISYVLFKRLLEAYVETACEYGPAGTQLFSGSEPFKPTAEFDSEIAALVACGYAERCGDMVKWTAKIAPAIQPEPRQADRGPEITLQRTVLDRVASLLQDRNPIAAIALVRAETGADLHMCKAYVDDLVQKSRRSK
ncbi:hypothetical protein [Bradyrhizobium sp. CCBAU 51765]|uniref:hypothetical protein n=1 Tax=Bradyrhizobium sp. CCBAU 51765 TaxID=1325102 RepID=UPI0018878118|nr:hypothetical protein [Bradyrhizobium sp. CCBAU 51765]QOZ11430.1 hypothetical protein XH96_30820 [Bradyrhizobium sp. CCBAU 51765]